MKLPLWLKILMVLLLLSVGLTVIGAVSPDLIGPVLVLVFVALPSKDRDRPWLIRALPWFWGLEIAASLFFLALSLAGKSFGGDDVRQPTIPELLSTIILLPPLGWALLTRNRWFKPFLIGSTVVFVGLSIWVYGESVGDLKAKLEAGSDLFTEAVITGFLLLKFKPASRSPSSEMGAEKRQLPKE